MIPRKTKITTLNKDMYTKIINPEIWEPDFKAREYKQAFTRMDRRDPYRGRDRTNTNINRKSTYYNDSLLTNHREYTMETGPI